jgi:hypothetical protein
MKEYNGFILCSLNFVFLMEFTREPVVSENDFGH